MTLKSKSHMPKNSLFFEKVVPALLIVLGILMLSLMVFAAAVIVGVIHF